MRWHAFNLQHVRDFKNLLGHYRAILELLSNLLWQVIRGKTFKVGQSVVQSGSKGTEDKFSLEFSLLFLGDSGVLGNDLLQVVQGI